MSKTMKKSSYVFTIIILVSIIMMVACHRESHEKQITRFVITQVTPMAIGQIDQSRLTIEVLVPEGTDLSHLMPTIEVSPKAKVSPASGTFVDFSSPVKYTVTAEDGTTAKYTVTVKEILAEETFTVGGVSFKMIKVEGGTFLMGAQNTDPTQDNYDSLAVNTEFCSESPVHRVTLKDFYIGQYEVTQELWEAVLGSNPSHHQGKQSPVETVSWNECQTFISQLNSLTGRTFSLPTEAQWEYAARGGQKSRNTTYSGSNNLDEVAWHDDNAGRTTHNVGTKSPNELGLYDMTGNVSEWCQDYYGKYPADSQTQPTGPDSGTNRVYRGGGTGSTPKYSRVSYRIADSPRLHSGTLGLRLVLQ